MSEQTNSLEQHPYREANSHTDSQEIPPSSMEPKGSLLCSQEPANSKALCNTLLS